MISIKVMKQENKYILKALDRLKEISIEAHYTSVLKSDEAESSIEFIEEYVSGYQHIKQEEILFRQVKDIAGKEIEPMIQNIIILHGRGNEYLEKMDKACRLYKEGRYLALYDFILNARAYSDTKKQSIEEEERLYKYVVRMLPIKKQRKIDSLIANFHGEIKKQKELSIRKLA